MAKTLQLTFQTAAGKQTILTVDNPRPGLTAAEAENAMMQIIQSQAFEVEGSPLSEVKSARVIERNTEVLI